jgi:hypothetical protein
VSRPDEIVRVVPAGIVPPGDGIVPDGIVAPGDEVVATGIVPC